MNSLQRLGVWIGGAGLLAAVAIDMLAVIGRNVGLPIVGSIELIQVAVLGSGVIGLVFATAHGDHARVRILTDRFARGRAFAEMVGPISMALLFAGLLTGSVWLAADLWNGYERSELLGIPWRVLRLFANIGFAICIVTALATLIRPGRR